MAAFCAAVGWGLDTVAFGGGGGWVLSGANRTAATNRQTTPATSSLTGREIIGDCFCFSGAAAAGSDLALLPYVFESPHIYNTQYRNMGSQYLILFWAFRILGIDFEDP
ncbi:hypothetical protein [Desulfotignum balticum]|uniref:hypothetical protein n=1 Tax=Desulfotignum balticum TaxID=115781 RepID=UPI00040A227B|nr:hypothetical protein [Desulfotignum balticum]